MANYYGSGRTNYFRVKDFDAFEQLISDFSTVESHRKEDGSVCLLVVDDDGDGSFPSYVYNDESEEYVDIDFFALVAEHLADDEVAIFQHVGAEKLRYLEGYSVAVTNDDTGDPQFLYVGIGDIYKRVADEWNLNPTRATY